MRGLLNFFLTFCISLAVLFPSDSSALGTNKPSDIKFGITMDSNPQPVGLTAPAQCNFSVYNDPTAGVTEADVTIFSGGTAGGSRFAYGGGINTGTPAITAADILAFCPFVAGSVTIVSQNGADGSYASDTYIGITYTAQPTGDTNFYTYSTGMQVVGGLTEVFNTRALLVVNTAPTANAGPDANAASAASVTLNGSGSSANDAGQTLTYWSAPIEWSSLNVSAWSASGLSASCFRARADGSAARYAV